LGYGPVVPWYPGTLCRSCRFVAQLFPSDSVLSTLDNVIAFDTHLPTVMQTLRAVFGRHGLPLGSAGGKFVQLAQEQPLPPPVMPSDTRAHTPAHTSAHNHPRALKPARSKHTAREHTHTPTHTERRPPRLGAFVADHCRRANV
jgi:hypothetical protein